MSNLVTSSLAIRNPGPVNLDHLSTFEKFEHQRTKEPLGRFQIHFMASDVGISIRDIYWKYSCECDRDAEYDKLVLVKTVTL